MTTSPEHDQDSMMALEALLNIKSNSFDLGGIPAVTRPLRSTADAVTILGNVGTVLNMDHHFIPMKVISAPSPFSPHVAVSPATTKRSVTTTQPLTKDADRPTSYDDHEASANDNGVLVVINSSTTGTSTPSLNIEADDVDSDDSVLRKEQIDAALRSKHQRGRKRDNLSVRERLELTRTRNREHAKSTRMRKKARYHELVEKEYLFDELKAHVDLEDARIRTVRSFVACRSNLLQPQLSPIERLQCREELHMSLYDATTFTFEGHGPQHVDAMTRMDMLEDMIRNKVVKALGEDVAGRMEYRLVDGPDAIAVTKTGVAMVVLDMVTKDKRNEDGTDILIMSALIRWKFSSESDKLTGMQWTTISDSLEQLERTDGDCDGTMNSMNEGVRNLLGMQLCHPSVISLDHGNGSAPLEHHHQHQELPPPPQSPLNGPGMNL